MNRFRPSREICDKDLLSAIQNLNTLDLKQAVLFESRMALIRELAYTICRGGKANGDEIKDNYLSALPSAPTSDSIADLPRPMELKKYFGSLSISERIGICKEISALTDVHSAFYESVFGRAESGKSGAEGRIAYVKNNFTDSAYLTFSMALKSPRCSYFDSFDAVCEDVHSGKSEFCILPVETSSDGKLLSFYSMIDRYELKIVSICTVEHQGGTKFTRFALLGRSVSFTLNSDAKGLRFELRISQSLSNTSPIYEILKAADACNMSLCRIDSLPLPYNDSMLSYYVVFDLRGADLKPFLTYLALECPQCYALGIYFEK